MQAGASFISLLFCSVSRGSGYKSSELETLQEGQSLRVGGKELEVCCVMCYKNIISSAI